MQNQRYKIYLKLCYHTQMWYGLHFIICYTNGVMLPWVKSGIPWLYTSLISLFSLFSVHLTAMGPNWNPHAPFPHISSSNEQKKKAYNKDKAQGRTRVHTQAAWLNCCRLKVNEVKDCNSMSGYLPQVITSEDLPYFLINIKEINVLNHLSDREKGQINKPRSMCKMWAPFFYKNCGVHELRACYDAAPVVRSVCSRERNKLFNSDYVLGYWPAQRKCIGVNNGPYCKPLSWSRIICMEPETARDWRE